MTVSVTLWGVCAISLLARMKPCHTRLLTTICHTALGAGSWTPSGTPACGDMDRHWRRSGGASLPRHLVPHPQSRDEFTAISPLTRRIVLMLM